ncbi:RraA family protein [Devosia aurantiaca]|uniref:Putative 4-hydroxy-4-methyl-2-oxoglutarate aldolase n=1 Tax=Devosia aurantiaca TaxID=2714858 RepID=A0A6M1SX41_9HYPH|nr:RraA family protein [Devosia aurantiaca]NGP18873.1 RraA family protein [Devosia aurantiaca]
MTLPSHSDDNLIAQMRQNFFCALLSDTLDELGHMHQALPARIRPLDDSLVMVGRARTMLYADVYARPQAGENPYELEIKLVDSLQADEVAVCACGGTGRIAPWGGLLSTASKVRGAAGALMDGMVRDIRHVRELAFPLFHAGIGPLDSKGRGEVIAIDVPVECAGVRINPGDIVFGDADGVVVIPQAIETEVVALAYEKLKGENKTRDALLAGRRLADVFDEFGVL